MNFILVLLMFGESSVYVSIDGIACHGECMRGVCVCILAWRIGWVIGDAIVRSYIHDKNYNSGSGVLTPGVCKQRCL